jgi:hypothetical protein
MQAQRPGMLAARVNRRLRGVNLMRSPTYEITFSGQAGTTLRAEFDDCEVTIGPGTTTLRAELPDQAALTGLVLRITGLNLEIILVRLVAPPSADREPGRDVRKKLTETSIRHRGPGTGYG